MPGAFAGKVVIVTGAGGGIGGAIAELFAQEGASVAVVDYKDGDYVPQHSALGRGNLSKGDVQPWGGRATAEKITAAGGSAKFFACDVSDEARVKDTITEIAVWGGGVDVLCNNAAVFAFKNVVDTTPADWDRILSVNVKGCAFCSKHAIPHMRQRGTGCAIVNTASISGFTAQESHIPYNTSKGAVMQLTRCMAADHGPEGIRVNMCASASPSAAPSLLPLHE